MWVIKYIEMCVKLFKIWKYVLKPHNQTGPDSRSGGEV